MADLAKKLRDISLADARSEYEKLKETDCMKNPGFSRIGLQTLDYFFLKHRIRAKTAKHISFYNALKNTEKQRLLNDVIIKYKKAPTLVGLTEAEHAKLRYAAFQMYFGSVNQFKPTIARWVYCTLGAKKGILDFSAGWGGRCLAAMSLGIPYIGIDANKGMEPTYRKMIETLDPAADVTLRFQPSETVDFSAYDYDLIFTSPPYFMLEEYEKMPAYGSKEAFLDKFFRPVVANSWKGLAEGGHMALNMPHEMYMAVRDMLPPVSKRLKLLRSNRYAVNAARGRAPGTQKGSHELIYIWKKGGKEVRRDTKRGAKGTRKGGKTKRVGGTRRRR
jgi:hypothetical protein